MKLLKISSIVLLNLFFVLTLKAYANGGLPVNTQVNPAPSVNKVSTTYKPISAAPPSSSYKPTQIQATTTNIKDCLRTYSISSDKLFYVALSAITNSNYKILEIQSNSAKVLFQAESKEFLLSVARQDNQRSLIKIAPANNSYIFPNTIVKRIYSYIDLNAVSPLEKII